MRELIVKRLEEIKAKEDNFSKSLMRWQNFNYDTECGQTIHISKVFFEGLPDDDLLKLYERVVIRLSKQM